MAWTMKANIMGPQGPGGADGQNVSLRVANGNIEWRLGTGSWQTLVPLSTITGANGADGKSVTIVGTVANAAALPTGLGAADAGKGYITSNDGHLHVWSGTAFTDVGTVRGPVGPAGADGAAGTDGDDGLSVELRNTGSVIEWRQGTGAWATLYTLAAITGPAGATGTPGTAGTNGLEVSLQNNGTNIQWRLGTGSWQNLVALASLKGDQGIQGVQGIKGDTGTQGIQGVKGDQGIKGDTGAQGIQGVQGVRGSQWFVGSGTPGTISGSVPGDMYLDQVSGVVYALEA